MILNLFNPNVITVLISWVEHVLDVNTSSFYFKALIINSVMTAILHLTEALSKIVHDHQNSQCHHNSITVSDFIYNSDKSIKA